MATLDQDDLDAIGALITAKSFVAETYEGTETVQDFLRLARAVLLGKASGGGTATIVFQDAADTKARVTLTVTSAGDRTDVVADPT